jgi:O-antigen ligase
MMVRLPRNFIFPLAIVAFTAVPVHYVNIVFTTSTRWVFLALLTLYLLTKRLLLVGVQSVFGVTLLSYCGWCMSTVTWSEIPQLSFAKALAFSLIGISFLSAGQQWIYNRGSYKALTCLAPVTTVALFCGSTGSTSSGFEALGGLYQGLTDNANMLGSLIAMALPLLLWSAYKYRATPQIRWVWFVLLAVAVGMLSRTYSRASILSAAMLAFGFFLSLKLGRTSFVLVLISASLLFVALLSTTLVDRTYQSYVLKGFDSENGVLYSRQPVWEKSLEAAVLGGWFGLGYGTAAGHTSFEGGLTAARYGREKGNAQLAVVEETGLVGLAFYIVLLIALFVPLIAAHRREKNTDAKVMFGIIIGALAGVTALSVFEAWWVAPGSPESAYFWSLAGVGLGLAQASGSRSKWARSIPIAREQPVYFASIPPHGSAKG